jgi:large subunit ribosomal protein L29
MLKSDMHNSSFEELEKELNEVLKEQFNLRMQHKTGQLNNNSQLKRVRREIARIKTIMKTKS